MCSPGARFPAVLRSGDTRACLGRKEVRTQMNPSDSPYRYSASVSPRSGRGSSAIA
ncbi:hypothetical protein I553_6526 [Mycobacterium xenopi 4042]|uniref:Uncharacterized protein n=1 Tax=Mycobacterium xenopi 4042 TaxID=1299334 RepID=X8BGQ1_MYCXE|nr:hypothetical protein I553_6526 [Mycobacterium xenopi 4042]